MAASLVANRVPSLFEFSKFAVVGVLNSGVDFGILNLLMLITGMSSGAGFLAFKSVSVTLGVINSYLWNKYWTFRTSERADARREFIAFMVVTLMAVGSQRRRRRRDRKRHRRADRNQRQSYGQTSARSPAQA